MTTDLPATGGDGDGDALASGLATRFTDAQVDESYGQVTVDVPAERWVEALTTARDDLGFGYFDWLTAVDQLDSPEAPGYDVVAHLWSLARREHLLLRTRVPAERAELATATAVFAGAAWHERETFEMFGVTFAGHPHLVPLLLPDGFEGHPLRKDFVLAARVAKPWPGAKEPGESEHDAAPSRRKTRPPGVPDPAEWGPHAPGAGAAPPEAPAAAAPEDES